jgi:membrane associated rhomboid family serine protease
MPRLKNAVIFPTILCSLIVLAFVLEHGMGLNFFSFGLEPRQGKGLIGIFTMVFIHADFKHLLQNILSLYILTSFLFYFYRGIAFRSLALMWLFQGLMLWFIGRESYHIGCSGLIYALAFFLFFSGIFRRHIPLAAVSAIVVFIYGSMVWGLLPWTTQPQISWEGHLSGAAVGLVFAIILKNYGPKKPPQIWADEPSDENPYWLETENQ